MPVTRYATAAAQTSHTNIIMIPNIHSFSRMDVWEFNTLNGQ